MNNWAKLVIARPGLTNLDLGKNLESQAYFFDNQQLLNGPGSLFLISWIKSLKKL